MRSWSLSFFNYIWPFWTEMERKVWVLTEIRGDEEGVICSLCLISPSLLWNISPCVCSSLLLSSPSPPPFFSSLTPCKLSLQHCLTFCIHLSIPVWIPFHLILTSQTLTLRYPSPPPPLIHPILPLLAWLIAETGPILRRGACKLSLTTATMSPPPIPSPSARIDYPTLQGDNQWAWPDFETWWVRACV